MDSFVRASGQIHIEFLDKSGSLINELRVKNRVVDTGLLWIIQRMAGLTTDTIYTMALGSGAIAATGGDATLGREMSRVLTTVTTTGQPAIVATATFVAGQGSGVISELGLFLKSRFMLARAVIPAQPKSSDMSMRITWTISLTS